VVGKTKHKTRNTEHMMDSPSANASFLYHFCEFYQTKLKAPYGRRLLAPRFWPLTVLVFRGSNDSLWPDARSQSPAARK
jgi:hypothetical protein